MRRLLAAVCAVLLLFAAGCGGSGTDETAAQAASGESQGQALLRDAASAEIPAPEEPVSEPEYAAKLFDTSFVHTIDIQADPEVWSAFIQSASEKEYIDVGLTIDGEPYEHAALRAKGNSSMQRSRQTGKYSFKVEFDHFADGLYYGLDKLALNNLSGDETCMRDYLVYRMMAAFGVPSPLCSFVFITLNGEDWGFYLAVEGIEDSFLERNYGPGHGALYKPDNLNNGGMQNAMRGRSNGDDVKLKYIDDDPASYPNLFGSAKTDVSRKDQYRLISSLKKLSAREDLESVVNTSEMLRYLVVQTFVCNGDSYIGSSVHNYYLYEDQGRLSMLPWDYNEAFGDFGSSGLASVVNTPIDTPLGSTMSERPMAVWAFEDETYLARYHALYQTFLDEICYSGWLGQTALAAKELIGPYVQRDPRSFTTYDAFLAGVDEHLLFFELRTQSVQGQLDGTIPATTAGQSAEPDALIDTSELPGRGWGSGGPGGGGMPSGGPSGASSEEG